MTATMRCSVCDLPVHRYSPNFPGHEDRSTLMGCVNSLRGALDEAQEENERLRAEVAAQRTGRSRRKAWL